MPELKQAELERVLKRVNKALSEVKTQPDYQYYQSLYPGNMCEADIAQYAIKSPELHHLMVKVARKIIDLTSSFGPLWADDEDQAGSRLTLALALYDKQYCELFADCLLEQDLDHEVYQNEYIMKIINKWGLCEETATILRARRENAGQHGGEVLTVLERKYGETLWEYLDADSWDVDDGECATGYEIVIQDKRTLETVTVSWDEGYPCLAVTYNLNQVKAFKYKTYEEVEGVVAGLKPRSKQLGYACERQMSMTSAKDMVQEWASTPEAPADIFSLFTPAGRQTALDKMNAQAFAGQPAIPCEKVQLYKGVQKFAVLLADPATYRILNPYAYEDKYLWQYKTVEEMRAGLAQMKQDYLADGYAIVLEAPIQHAFDYALQMTEQTARMLKDAE